MNKVYEVVTTSIMNQLEKGVIPWRRPFSIQGYGIPINWRTQTAYRGANALLPFGEYATFKQIKEAGGKVKKGEKSHVVVFWKLNQYMNKNEDGKEEITNVPIIQRYNVFNVNTQVEGLSSRRKAPSFDHDPIQEAEEILQRMTSMPDFSFSSQADYDLDNDIIIIPPKEQFKDIEKYYSTLFHELIHSTGHENRLNRKLSSSFGSEEYSKEELIAEMGAAMLCQTVGINNTLEHNAAYIQGWLTKLKNDKWLVIKAASQAQKAVDYILGKEWGEDGIQQSTGDRDIASIVK
ncbi:ArdC family protein [Longirhabdus pacifica]|uniref:ArdC family protein n=1 Tax=Longirhabdus pacifica TaxID=2305227 RepID=UPI00100939D1|nr:zincin-like metallopeptidase domain-containing protein [Longirhabdus pacifica]